MLLVLLLGLFVASCYSVPDLTINNTCNFGLWIEARASGGLPLPGNTIITYVAPKKSFSFDIPDNGCPSTRFWAKYGCNSKGSNCLIGDQMVNHDLYPNTGGCPFGGCDPPVDSLFEATWGCQKSSGCPPNTAITWFDTSQVDGWTIPYRVLLHGNTQCDCNGAGCTNLKVIDATKLGLQDCPTGEDMSYNGKFPQYNHVDLRIIKNNTFVACNSPCKKFTNAVVQGGLGLFEGSIPAEYYCCPTPDPNNCSPDRGCITPQVCRSGPVPNTQYVKNVHKNTNGLIYAYSYDDLVGLHTCPAAGVTYTMEFCPPGSPQYPGSH